MIFVTTIGNQQEKIHTIATARPWRRIWDRREITIMAAARSVPVERSSSTSEDHRLSSFPSLQHPDGQTSSPSS
jgi:hypothetical protein